MNHTPTPWTTRKFNDTKKTSIYSENGTSSLGSIVYGGDAEFIVTACNSHEALVKVCEALLINQNSYGGIPEEIFDQAGEALALAGEKP